MRDVKLTDEVTLTFYESIKELPITASKRMSTYLVQDAGIGADMEAVDEHLGRLTHYLAAGRTDDAVEEVKNLRYNLFVMLMGMDHKSMALMCLVHSVNGVPVKDYSESGLQRMVDMIGDTPSGELAALLEEVKKNLIPNADTIFREYSPTT